MDNFRALKLSDRGNFRAIKYFNLVIFLHGLLSNIKIRIPILKNHLGLPLHPALWYFWAEKGGHFLSIA
jgi:hypothetical protein